MQIHTGKISANANINMQNLLQFSKESNVKLEKPTFFDTPAAEVFFSREGMSALREQQNQSEYTGYIESREVAMAKETRYWIDNEIELEHYFAMREMSGQTLKDKNYDVKDLMKLYSQLDFTAPYEENSRVGYQYSMRLLDADENKLQSVTPYKDGVTIDGIFYQYDNTNNGDGVAASLRLIEYLEYIMNSE